MVQGAAMLVFRFSLFSSSSKVLRELKHLKSCLEMVSGLLKKSVFDSVVTQP
jgi:hypothetical protein